MNNNVNILFQNPEFSRNDDEKPEPMLWLSESYCEPEKFWNTLKNKRETFFKMPGKSIPFVSYNFFHDIILCNRNSITPAFRWFDPNDGWGEISYSELGRLSCQMAASFQRSGVTSGDRICLINRLNKDFLVRLLSALKIGAVISILPPSGETFLAKRIKALSPDYISCEETFRYLVQPFADIVLPENGSTGEPDIETSHAYEAAATVFLAFDQSGTEPHIPVEVASDTAYLNPMRDGIIALGVRPGKSIAAPDFDFLESQPGLILSVLINGGTFVHIEPEDIFKKPDLLLKYKLENVGLTPEVRDCLLKKQLPVKDNWKCWFRNPSESMNLMKWNEITESADIKDVPAMNLKWEASLCGCSLFSPKITGEAHLEVFPSAGCNWTLTDISGNALEAFDQFGLLTVSFPGKETDECFFTTNIITINDSKLIFSGNNVKGRFGRHYPVDEIRDLIKDVNNCSLCSIDISSSGEEPVRRFITLMIFTGSYTDYDQATIIKQIKETIIKEYSKFYLMDKYVFYPLLPRFTGEKKIDHKWCSSQCANGSLIKKSKDELYHCLTELKELVYA